MVLSPPDTHVYEMVACKCAITGSCVMKDFKLDCPFDGNVAKAMDVVTTTLLPHGFRVLAKTAHDVTFKGPPMPQSAYQTTQFWGASLVKFSHDKRTLHLAVEMGELNKSSQNAAWIGIVMLGLAALAASAVIGAGASSGMEMLVMSSVVLITVGFCTAVIGWTKRSWENKSREAYETVLANAAILAREM